MSQTWGGYPAFVITNQCLSTPWGKSGKTLVHYDKLIVRNGLIVTRSLCYSPNICMVYYRTITTQPSVQLKEGFWATKSILLCSQRNIIRLAENPLSKFWIGTPHQIYAILSITKYLAAKKGEENAIHFTDSTIKWLQGHNGVLVL